MKRVFLFILLVVVIGIVGIATYLKLILPNVESAPDINVTATPAQIQRGEYLAMHVAACMDCHSTRDWTHFSGPLIGGTLGKGGEYFGPEMGIPGKFYSKNLTPAHLGDWTDGEIFRAITSGVNKEGKALFPIMPYPYYSKMDKEDVFAIIAYLRTLSPIDNFTPASEPDFPMNFIINTIPMKPDLSSKPSASDPIKYGEYLVNTAACIDCHTQFNKGQPLWEMAFAGGREFNQPTGVLRSANITPDLSTGIGSWSESMFINRFKAYEHSESTPLHSAEEVNTIMPWTMYAGMETDDLAAIFAYLKTLKPIENKVIHFSKRKKDAEAN